MPAITSAVLSDIIYDTGIMWGGIFFVFMHIIWGAKTKTEDRRRLYVQNIHTSICPCFHSVFYVHSLNSKQVEFLYQGSIVTMTKSLFISVIAH